MSGRLEALVDFIDGMTHVAVLGWPLSVLGIAAGAAAINGIDYDKPVENKLTVIVPYDSYQLKCVGKHTLRLTMPDGAFQDMPVGACSQQVAKR